MKRRKGFRKKSVAWILTLTMAFTGMGVNFAFATDGGDDPEIPVTVDKTAQWVDPDEGIAEVSLTVNSGELEITSSATSRIVLVLDCSKSMSSNNKFSNMKTTARAFVDQMLPPGNTADTQIALVGYNDRADQNHGFEGNATGIKNNITGLSQGSGTHIQDGIKKGQEYLDGVTADNEFIVVLSDGEPTYSFKATKAIADSDDVLTNYSHILTEFSDQRVNSNYSYTFTPYNVDVEGGPDTQVSNHGHATVSQAYLAKQKGTTIYSIGFDIAGNSNAKVIMQDVASAGKYYSASSGDLDDVFANISQSITEIIQASGATVTDPVGFSTDTLNDMQYKFEGIITDNVNYPITTTVPSGAVAGSYSYDESTDQFTWHLTTGNVKAGEYTFTYFVDLDVDGAGTELENVLTNDGAQLAYTDGDGVAKTADFNDPELPITHYTVEYYYSENGGLTYTKDDSLTDKLNAIVGCTNKTDAGLKAAGEKAGYDYIKTEYGDSDTATSLAIDSDQSKNTIKIYYSRYYAQGTVPLAAFKNYNKTLSGGEFSFKAQAADEEGNIITGDGAFSTSVTNLALGIVGFSLSYDQDDIGNTYYYLISEDSTAGTLANKSYIDYSDESYLAKVEVKDTDHDGTLDFEVTYYAKDDSDEYTVELTGCCVPSFTNEYSAEKTINLTAKKVLENMTLSAGDFTFDAVEVGPTWTPVSGGWSDSDVSNAADGSIEFKDIDYTQEDDGKTFYYMITEDAGSAGGIDYDDQKLVIKVEVTDNEDGTMTAAQTVEEGDADKEFTNTYSAEKTINLTAKKVLENMTLSAGDFTFDAAQVEKVEGAWTPVSGGWSDSDVSNAADGSIEFKDIDYTQDDDGETFYYMITEDTGSAGGIDYDDQKLVIKVEVTDNEDGTMTAVQTVEEGDADKEFTNTFEGKITVNKDFFVDGEKLTNETEFKVGLFKYGPTPPPEQSMIMIKIDEAVVTPTTPAVFDGLGTGEYFVYELDKDGNPLKDAGDITGKLDFEGVRTMDLGYEGNEEIQINTESHEQSMTVTNTFRTDQDFYFGGISVTKNVLVNGQEKNMDKTFYAALFTDQQLTERATDQNGDMIPLLALKGGETKEFGGGLDIEKTYYVAETDENGNIITDPMTQFGMEGIKSAQIEYSGCEAIVLEPEKDYMGSALIINKFTTSGNDYYDEPIIHTVKVSATSESSKTGDDSNMGLWILLALLGMTGIVTPLAIRRKNVNK